MANEKKNVTLEVTTKTEKGSTTRKEDFTATLAERLLGMSKNGGWRLPKDSKFTYSADNGLRLRADKRGNKQASE